MPDRVKIRPAGRAFCLAPAPPAPDPCSRHDDCSFLAVSRFRAPSRARRWTVREEEPMSTIERFIQDESGQDLVEYALLAAFIAIVTIATLRTLGTKVSGFYATLAAAF
jgi:pilus assembly protein Flp/PilA